MGVEVAIGSAAAISKVVKSNGQCPLPIGHCNSVKPPYRDDLPSLMVGE